MRMQKRATQAGGVGSDKFIKFKDGESKSVILRGEIFEFYMKWVNGKSQAAQPDDPEAKSRFKVNAVVSDGASLVAKIWEFPLTIYNKLADINEEYPLETTVLKITRQGTGTDTEYHILPILKQKVPASISNVELNILGTQTRATPSFPGPDPVGDEPWPDEDETIPF